jgi:hypothetical protein
MPHKEALRLTTGGWRHRGPLAGDLQRSTVGQPQRPPSRRGQALPQRGEGGENGPAGRAGTPTLGKPGADIARHVPLDGRAANGFTSPRVPRGCLAA